MRRRSPSPAPPVEEPRPEFSEFLANAQGTGARRRRERRRRSTPRLANLEPLEVVVERDRSAGRSRADDRSVRVAPADARRSFAPRLNETREHRADLSAIAKKYGVSSSLLVAIWGMESNFGRFTGTRPTVQALATLAWEGRRRAFFTTELINALQILDKGYIELDQMKGSWAGAMGQTQFMPSSYLAHAQDLRRRRPPRHLEDAARRVRVDRELHDRLRLEGRAELWGREVKVPAGGATKLAAVGRIPPERLPRRARADRADPAGEMAVAGRADGAGQRAAESRSIGVAAARRHEVLPGLLAITTRCSATTARTPTRWRLACFPIAMD